MLRLVVGSLLELLQHASSLLGQASVKWSPENTDRLPWGFLNCAVRHQAHSVLSWVSRVRYYLQEGTNMQLGNAVAARASWRWVYWVPFILNCIGFVMVFLFYRPKNQYIKEEGKSRLQEVADLDWVGFALWTAGLLLFLLGISFGGNQMPW
jgi:hypothetical protein